MDEKSKFTEEAERLARKASEAKRPSEKKMLETYSRFYEVIGEEPAQAPEPQTPSPQQGK